MTDTPKPPMVVWLDVDGTSDRPEGRRFWGNWSNSKLAHDNGPYVHLEQFMEEVERRADAKHATTMRQYSSDFMEAMQELAKEIMEGKA